MNDNDLLQKVQKVFEIYLNDINSSTPYHDILDIPHEIHGQLADILYLDKPDNIAVINLLIGLVTISRSEDDTRRTLNEIYKVIVNINNYRKEYNYN